MARVTLERPGAALAGTDEGEGAVALLLHAGGERRQVWQPVSEILVARGFRTVAYDQRGHGESTAGGADELPALAGDVAAMVASLPGRPVLVGASLGGFACIMALGDPGVRSRVAGLVLVDVVPDPDPARALAFLAEIGLDGNPRVHDVLARIPQLREVRLNLPTVLVRAGGPSPLAHDDVDRFLAATPHARVAVIGDASHLVARDAPAALADEIARALTEANAQSA